jgi:hypothetical protein
MTHLSHPDKEAAVIGYLGTRGFEGIPAGAVVEPESFSSTLHGIFYAAAHGMHRSGRPVQAMTMLEAVERTPHWLRAAESEAKEKGMIDWRDAVVLADHSLSHNPQGGKIVAELLGDIAEAYLRRRSVEIAGLMQRGEMDFREAMAELQKLAAPRNGMQGVEVHSFKNLFAYEPENDESTLLGDRWVCKGGQLLLVGQSGIGKSSLTVQAAVTWALGLPFFGIQPARPLRSLFVQAENDLGDMSEIAKGILPYVIANSRMPEARALEMLKENILFARVTSQVGEDFVGVVRELLHRHGPRDLVFGDPLLSYIGDDISQQSVASHFLRQLCNPIAFEHGFAWVWSHHTGKPQSDSKSRQHWNTNDFAYIGLGSSELTNWARAIAVLQTTKHDGIFKLLLAKRGSRAAVLDEHGHPTTDIVLKHAAKGLHWEPAELPEESADEGKPHGKAGRTPKISPLEEAEIIARHAAWPVGVRGFYGEMSAKYGVSRDTIERILKRSKDSTQGQKAA